MFKAPSLEDVRTDLIIIGAGVAGITLAKQLQKANLDFWIMGSPFESQLAKAGELQNTNLPEGTVGLDYIQSMMDEIKEMGVKNTTSQVKSIDIGEEFVLHTFRQKFIAKKIVLATGCKQTKLGFPGEKELFHKGISDCSVCDFPLYMDRVVGVVGSHEYTARAAELLAIGCKQVHLFWYRSDEAPEVSDKIIVHPKVDQIEAYGDEIIEGVKIITSGTEENIQLNGLFVEGNPIPNVSLVKDQVSLTKESYISIDENFQTSVNNLYAIGDVTGSSKSYEEAKLHAVKAAEMIIKSVL